MPKFLKTAAVATMLLASPAAAELELSFYMGIQSDNDSTASGNMPNTGAPFSRKVKWEANPFDNPYYYGGRAMWWTNSNLGFGVEGTHTKAYASTADRTALGVSRLEFSDGHNIVTANVMKRFPGAFEGSKFTPYAGAGIGVAIPHVDAQVVGSPTRTHDFEMTGLALRGIAGMKYAINDKWSLFSEYQIIWSDNEATINGDPGMPDGKLRTEITTHAVNVGFSYSF